MADEQCLYCNHKQGKPTNGCERSLLESRGQKYKRKCRWHPECQPCPDCHTPHGRYHHSGCLLEPCPRCGVRLASPTCTCFKEPEPEPIATTAYDRFRPLKGRGEHQAWVQDLADEGRVVCECYSLDDAARIASLLSKDHAERTGQAGTGREFKPSEGPPSSPGNVP